MKKYFTLLLFFPMIILATEKEKVLVLKKINTPIKVDGIIDEAWSKADSATDFFQLQPFYGKPPTKNSFAKVLTTETSLYCLIVCYDEKQNIQQNTGKQDDMGGDVVSIMLDTFGDKQSAYKFAVNAAGTRADCRLLDDARNRDYSWDGIWFSDSKIYDWGYVIEIEIPYKSIQYDEKLTSWGLDFDRWRPLNSEDLYWCEYTQNEGQRISKFGKLLFEEFKPSIKGLNLEFYPTVFGKIDYIGNNKYKVDPKAGIDIFYNPSPQLTVQATAYPDFAQIEADPYEFNISRYEVFFSEHRPFFVQGREIFMPSGADRNSGFYRPLELFYSRRIGKKLQDGSEVPITFGAKAFGRLNDWEYGGFVARTEQKDFTNYDGSNATESTSIFVSGRVKKQILDNSSLGILFVGKQTTNNTYGVIDIDGAFRGPDWQLAYQVARSVKNSDGDFAVSAGFRKIGTTWINLFRGRYVGSNFDIDQIGFVPWRGTAELVTLTGPVWYPKEGEISQILIFTGPAFAYEKVDSYTDWAYVLGMDMSFRNNMGYEVEIDLGKFKDLNVKYDFQSYRFSGWINQAKWNANIYGGYQKTYNFSRNYLAGFGNFGARFSWKIFDILEIGTSYYMGIEGNPNGNIEEISYNARPYFSLTPINDLNIRTYVDNTWRRSGDGIDRAFIGLLFAYQFSPKSWLYFALNEVDERDYKYDSSNRLLESRMMLTDRVSVFKLKYLYYF